MPIPLKLNDTHRRLVILIRRHQPISRAELGKIAGLGSGPVTQITRDLLLAGLICEGERVRGRRGQPALPLMLDPTGAISFGVALTPGKLRVTAIDFAGEVLDDATAPAAAEDPEALIAVAGQQIDQICKRLRVRDRSRILGVGLALPGFFFEDNAHMRIVDEHASWREKPLSQVFADALALPCWIENDATAAAIAEFYRARVLPKCMITLLINYGVGGGAVIDGRPFRGSHGNAGEIGAFFPLDAPRPSGTDLLNLLRAEGVAVESLPGIDWGDATHRAVCERWADRAGAQLRTLIDAAWSWLDPDLVTISGALPAPLLDRLVEAVDGSAIFGRHPDRPYPVIRASELGAGVSAIGAAHLPLHVFSSQMS